ncbi:MAG TPA: hypothetical protein P5087_02195 [Eubacteriales bacterium]|nr:hypothetical protein [Eubacteriales bacterium]
MILFYCKVLISHNYIGCGGYFGKIRRKKYLELVLQEKLIEAVDYVKGFSTTRRLAEKYRKLYEAEPRKLLKMSQSKTVNEILAYFQEYYYDVFWAKIDEDTARKTLAYGLAKQLEIIVPELNTKEDMQNFFDEKIEPALEKTVTKEGFFYRGGDTRGHLGPYIWQTTEPKVFHVELPSGKYKYTVNILKGFISRSWLAYISFGSIGISGWTGEDRTLNCVWKDESELKKSIFQIDFLKHTAQHAYDYEHFKDMSAVDMEYRAKLVQLIYAINMTSFKNFMLDASKDDPDNSLAYSSYMLISNLSKKIFDIEFESDMKKWKEQKQRIPEAALQLLNEYKENS